MEYNSKLLGGKLREYRLQYNLSQLELSKKIGVAQSYIADIENGNAKKSTIDTILKFADFFEISLDVVFEDYLDTYDNKIKDNKKKIKIIQELSNMNINKLEYINDFIDNFINYKNKT